MGHHECKMYYFCFDRLSCCRVSCDKARTAEWGVGGWGAVALQKLRASGNRGDRQDWLGHGVTPTIPIIFRCYSDYVYTHTTGGLDVCPLHAYKRAALYLHP